MRYPRWLVRAAPIATVVVMLALAVTPARANSVAGAWTPPFNLGLIAIHAVVLPTGKVLVFEKPDGVGSRARLWDPGTGAIADVSLTRARDIFCSAHSLLSDGRVFIAGGHVPIGSGTSDNQQGPKNTDFFDATANTWTAGPPMATGRYYPTTIELPDGSILVFSGNAGVDIRAKTVERYDPSTNSMTQLPASATKQLDLYPHLHLMPSGQLFHAGPEKATSLFDPASSRWSLVDAKRFGMRNNGGTVLLPGLQRVLAVGGSKGGQPTPSAEIIDFTQAAPKWRLTARMSVGRVHANAVLLADGTVLMVGGRKPGRGPMLLAEVFDPETETWKVLAPQKVTRAYHSTAVLLPDGRVLSAGQGDGKFETTGEVFSPPYLFKGERPAILSAPAALTYAQPFEIATADPRDIARVALVKPGAATHSLNFDQRYVAVSFAPGNGIVSATAPAGAQLAPPGWYMLFIINRAGVPSVSSWVHVGP